MLYAPESITWMIAGAFFAGMIAGALIFTIAKWQRKREYIRYLPAEAQREIAEHAQERKLSEYEIEYWKDETEKWKKNYYELLAIFKATRIMLSKTQDTINEGIDNASCHDAPAISTESNRRSLRVAP